MNGNFTIGTISALAGVGDDTRYIQISAPLQPGNSGCPLLDGYGNVAGVVVSKLNVLKIVEATRDVAQNVNFVIKATVPESVQEKCVRFSVRTRDKT